MADRRPFIRPYPLSILDILCVLLPCRMPTRTVWTLEVGRSPGILSIRLRRAMADKSLFPSAFSASLR